MENMTRENLRALGITDEKILDGVLAMRGNEVAQALEREKQLSKDLANAVEKAKDVEDLAAKIKELEIKNMTAEELQARKIEEAELSKSKYETMSNKLQAKEILLNAGMQSGDTMERILDKISSNDLTSTLDGANTVAEMLRVTRESTEQAIKTELLNNNPKPDPSNAPDSDVMTKEKFDTLSYEQMVEYAQKDPEGFAKM